MGGVSPDSGPPGGVKAPDGGWGWAVLFGCFVITGFSYAFPKAVSVFFKELIKEFHIGYSDTAWISSIVLAMLYGTGPMSSILVNRYGCRPVMMVGGICLLWFYLVLIVLSGPMCSILVNRYGCRPVMMVGGIFASLGMIMASFATSIFHIYLTTGVITGMGLAMNFQPSLIMLNRYFNEKRPLANGLAAAGSPVALCCLSPLGQMLSYQYGWRGGFLVLGGLLLNCCVCGALMRPLNPPKRKDADQENCVEEKKDSSAAAPKSKLLDFSVCRDRGFMIYTLAAAIMVLGLFVPPVFVVSRAKHMGTPDTQAALLLTILGFIDIFARPTCGVIAGLRWVRPRCVYLFSFAMIFNGTTDLLGSFAQDYNQLVIFCIFFGISYGMVGALQFEVLMTIVGTERFSSAIGLVLLAEAIAVLVGPPSAGRLLDYTHSYQYVFMLAGSEVCLSAVVLATCYFLFMGKKEAEPPAQEDQPGEADGDQLALKDQSESGDTSDNSASTSGNSASSSANSASGGSAAASPAPAAEPTTQATVEAGPAKEVEPESAL